MLSIIIPAYTKDELYLHKEFNTGGMVIDGGKIIED